MLFSLLDKKQWCSVKKLFKLHLNWFSYSKKEAMGNKIKKTNFVLVKTNSIASLIYNNNNKVKF